ncbi:MAG TPA: SusC/RagA family TonB-linked outer membrane protein [Puia sp.]|nr:SusC/RagA family TonB-linked outer membrane protein [Puia sp.]
MKLTAIILLVGFLQLSARTNAQPITISLKNARLETVFREIIKQTGFNFVYNNRLIAKSKSVDVDVRDGSIDDVLHQCLRDQQLEYEIVDKTIIVKPKPTLSEFQFPNSPPGEVTGRVTTEQGEPLENANITIKRTKKGTITNANGEFTLKDVRPDDEISVSFVGYENQTIKKIGNRKDLVIFLKIASNELDKAIVEAYGKTSKRYTTSDIGGVTAEEIEREPIMNPLLALQGKVAGLDVIQTNGYASAPIKVELRGRSSISPFFTSDPLYVIDGVPIMVLDPGGYSSYANGSIGFDQTDQSPAGGQSPLFSVNPADIESIEVLKDADATAIYGSRGANGVIIITTKKSKAGKTKLDLHVQEGIDRVSRFWDMMNNTQYLSMRREAFRNDGLSPNPVGDYDINGTWDTTKYTNWQKILWGGVGKTTDAEGSLTGGDTRTTFRLGAGFNRTTGITTISGADQRISFSLNLTHHSQDQRLSISLNSIYNFTISDMIAFRSDAVKIAPDAPPIFDSLGNLNYYGWGGASLNNNSARSAFPFQSIKQPYSAKTNFLNGSLNIGYQLAKGLKFSTNLGYNLTQANQMKTYPIASYDPETNPTGSLFLGYNTNKNLIVEPQINYNTSLYKGTLSVLVGSSYSETQTDGLSVVGSGYTDDELLQSISNAATVNTNYVYGRYKYAAIFGRVTYEFQNKFILNVNARRDGSSRFGPGKQFGNFGSIGGAWIFTEEPWLKGISPILNFGKLRLNYGITGSDNIGDYGYLSRYGSPSNATYTGTPSLAPLQNPNPDYQWQVDKKLEAGVNLGLFKERINLDLSYYVNKCGNQLIQFPTPVLTGFANVPANSPALIQNTGLEISIQAVLLKLKNFNWSIGFNTSFNQNKLVSYPDFSQSPYVGLYHIGKPLNIQNALHYLGVDPQTGQYAFLDKNHDGVITYAPGYPNDDTHVINLTPKFFGGLWMTFLYKSLRLDVTFNIKEQLGTNAFAGGTFSPGGLNQNAPSIIAGKEWQKPGDIAAYSLFSGKYMPNNSYFSISEGGLTDASFIRLNNLSISYELPASYLMKLGIKTCRLFFHANNLILITRYTGIDPETQNFGGLPPSKTLVGGLSFSF